MTHRLPFSPWYRFRVTRPLIIEGRAYTYNEAISADAQARISHRLLRQLYEQRRIEPLAIEMPAAPAGIAQADVSQPAKPDEHAPSTVSGPPEAVLAGESDLEAAERAHKEGVERRSKRKASA